MFMRLHGASRAGYTVRGRKEAVVIKVVIVEDKKAIREGLSVLLCGTGGVDCAGAYESCEDMLPRLAHDDPDVILMDIGLPGMSGIEGIEEVRKVREDAVIVVLSVYEDDENIFEALCRGASGYLVKNTPPARLIEAITAAHAGGSPMTSRIARRVVEIFRRDFRGKGDPGIDLTDREREVLSGLSEGESYGSIADTLCISVDTVRYHIRNIYRKLQVHSQSAAVSKAIRRGLI
jgi:DNA-binding NarL/FixJ family response regulator